MGDSGNKSDGGEGNPKIQDGALAKRGRAPSFKRSSRMNSHEFESIKPETKILTADEKLFLLNVERGNLAQVRRIVTALGNRKQIFDINCVDPLGRSSLVIAIENENLELMQYLLECGIAIKDSLLVAIREDYVDGVDCLLRFEEANHQPGTAYSWEAVDQVTANFTSDITPLILAAQRNNYEILKMLLDRGASIPMPHDVKCSCDDCVEDSADDSLRFSLARINAYKALSSPSLIALSSKDPILTAFELSNELKRLSMMESQFREVYSNLRKQVQELATGLIDHARTSYELEVLLNHNPEGKPWRPGEFQTLERLTLAIEYNQKKFVTHASVQQLLAAIWYDGLPGFRRMHVLHQCVTVAKHACLFPVYSFAYLISRHSSWGQFAQKPFVKFISSSASYMFFLLLLALASQRVEYIIVDFIVLLAPENEWTLWLSHLRSEWEKHERGSLPSVIELGVITWVQALVIKELKTMYHEGLFVYLSDMWNLADLMSYGAFLNWIGLRSVSFLMVQKELWEGVPEEEVYIPRDQWRAFDPHLLAEGMFGAGMISSFLKLIHIFSINPYLGPLQVSLGKMVIDIAKWLILYILVLFSFGCGLNQLLWYYADLEKQNCYSLPGGLPDFENQGDSCVTWRRFANLWETSQSLFWASFGLVELGDFELTGIKAFTRFWGLLMFGSYSVCNIIVLLNMLIAMMSNSYTLISERSDMEWKFARSKLWISYFSRGNTVAPPLNLIPTPRGFKKIAGFCCKKDEESHDEKEEQKKANSRYYGVVGCLVRRYITDVQRRSADDTITEDDINEVRQDIRSFRYELINILRMNDMKTPNLKDEESAIGKKSKDLERMIQKGFNLAKAENVMESIFGEGIIGGDSGGPSKNMFKKLVQSVMKKEDKDKDKHAVWNEKARQSSKKYDPIGSTKTSIQRRNKSFRRSMLERGNSQDEIEVNLRKLDSDQLVHYNPKLKDYSPLARIAYARFKGRLMDIKEPAEGEDNGEEKPEKKANSITSAPSADGVVTKVTIEDETKAKSEVPAPTSDAKEKVPLKKEEENLTTAVRQLSLKRDDQAASKEASVVQKFPVKSEKCDVEQAVPSEKGSENKPDEKSPDKQSPGKTPRKSIGGSAVQPVGEPEPTPAFPVEEVPATPPASPPKEEKEEPKKTPKKSPLKKEKREEPEPVTIFDQGSFDPRGKSVTSGKAITGWI